MADDVMQNLQMSTQAGRSSPATNLASSNLALNGPTPRSVSSRSFPIVMSSLLQAPPMMGTIPVLATPLPSPAEAGQYSLGIGESISRLVLSALTNGQMATQILHDAGMAYADLGDFERDWLDKLIHPPRPPVNPEPEGEGHYWAEREVVFNCCDREPKDQDCADFAKWWCEHRASEGDRANICQDVWRGKCSPKKPGAGAGVAGGGHGGGAGAGVAGGGHGAGAGAGAGRGGGGLLGLHWALMGLIEKVLQKGTAWEEPDDGGFGVGDIFGLGAKLLGFSPLFPGGPKVKIRPMKGGGFSVEIEP